MQFEWNPFVAPELPKFVYNVTNPTDRANALVLPRRGGKQSELVAR